MKIQLKSYLQFKFHATGVIFTMVTMFPHFPPKCGACVSVSDRGHSRQLPRVKDKLHFKTIAFCIIINGE